MSAFRVWIRSLGGASRIRVEGQRNVEWLLARLSESFIFKSSAPLREERDLGFYSFQVIHGSHATRASLERKLAAIPELILMCEPA